MSLKNILLLRSTSNKKILYYTKKKNYKNYYCDILEIH